MNGVLAIVDRGYAVEGTRSLQGFNSKSKLTIADLMIEDRHPDLLDSECERMWRLVRETLGQTPISIPLDERVAMMRLASEGVSMESIAAEFGYPEELVNLNLVFERNRLRKSDVLKEYYDAFYC